MQGYRQQYSDGLAVALFGFLTRRGSALFRQPRDPREADAAIIF
jgi:hypothetical protein